MDMSKFNEDIKNASEQDVDDGPRYPDGRYMLAVVDHDEKNKGEKAGNGEYPQVGLWVTFKILQGEFKGKDFSKYFGLRHPTSKPCVRYGRIGLKKLYIAVNFLPVEFAGIYGKRFIGTLESKKNPEGSEYAWSTDIVKYEKAPEPQGQAFAGPAADTKPDVTPGPANAWNSQQEIDEIPF